MRSWTNRPRIASENIICYKVFSIKKSTCDREKFYLQSPFARKNYSTKERLDTIPLAPEFTLKEISIRGIFTNKQGYHTFKDIKAATELMSILNNGDRMYTTVIECIIPKGSKYIKGICSLYHINSPTKKKVYKNYKSIVSEDLILNKSIFQNDNITIEKCK